VPNHCLFFGRLLTGEMESFAFHQWFLNFPCPLDWLETDAKTVFFDSATLPNQLATSVDA